ncbi:polysaccharide lyase 8 family protein [Sphingobacterium sp. HMA12]|uniref:polysaccharide lyase 8 family protein n=1 Tax=Sphingobacterium sp. HMA12 TaxID=2050894 RepID=UPI0013154A17|nr:polysaccharide lyase 8 family protein [Sphingobacterium sp. HMA12]
MKAILIFLLSFGLVMTRAQDKQTFDRIKKHVYEDELQSSAAHGDKTTIWSNQLTEAGTWSDIDYTSKSISLWPPGEHLDRLRALIVAYVSPKSKSYQQKSLYDKIVRAAQYWANNRFESTNWWHNEIASPKAIGVCLILMKFGQEKIPATVETALVKLMERGDPYKKTGANKSDIAMHYFYRALILEDTGLLAAAMEQLLFPIQLVDGKEGLQYDFSYLQHGPQLYIAGYGEEFLKGISKVMAYVRETPYAVNKEKLALFEKFLLETYLPIIRSRYIDFNVHGRGISRPDILRKDQEVAILQQMQLIDPAKNEIWKKGLAKLDSIQAFNAEDQSLHRHYWKGDYTTHLRKQFHFNLRVASKRTNKSESGNGENMLGKNMTDGVTNIQVFGPEYYNIMPVWEWDKIPGTTTRDYQGDQELKEQWGVLAANSFSGGVSNGTIGASAMSVQYDGLAAQKAWFFFDKEIVCLGSGINCSAAEPVVTTLNQTWLNGPVVWNGKEKMSTDSLVRNVKQGEYVMHNQVGYYFPEAMKIALTAKEQSGSWYRINRSRSKDAVHGKVFKLWFEHARGPVNGSYAYIVVPGVERMDKHAMQQLKIWHNTPAVQAVEHQGLAAIQAVFYESGTYQIGAWSIQVDKPVILQITKGNSVFKLDVADPLQQGKAVRIHLVNKRAKVNQTVEIKLPQAEYAGSTSSETIQTGNK